MHAVRVLAVAVMLALSANLPAQQLADRLHVALARNPMFPSDSGPRILVDEAHNNGMTLGDRLTAFSTLVRSDGFRLAANTNVLTPAVLARADVLMISNARPSTSPDAFSPLEIRDIRAWVENGGALLLVADHMPLAAPVRTLAAAFGVEFTDSFTMAPFLFDLDADAALEASYLTPTPFRREDGTLRSHSITAGRDASEQVSQVATFTGQAFLAGQLEPLLVFPRGFVSVFPQAPWEFRPTDRRINAEGLIQGGVRHVGRGRAAFFGEAAMFTAQIWGPDRIPMGLNHPLAVDNAQFVLNVLRWLSGRLA